jgi:prepilin-type N-terminal cleavage/methylation domain-containing protein/prepilin-type processing-associated H-X9-DG protein
MASGTGRKRRHGFTLVELLVVTTIIGVLIALLLPVLSTVRESSRRTSCGNNLRQLGIATQAYHAAHSHFPTGAVAKKYDDVPTTPWTFYRWSALAMLTPYLENTAAYNALNLDVPLYSASLAVSPQNREGVKILVAEFLCPSDISQRVHEQFGPTNYAACAGSGMGGGTPRDTDGVFYVNSAIQMAHIRDGSPHTVLMSESILGVGGTTNHDVDTGYKFHFISPLTEAMCDNAVIWNYQDPRGFGWANGEYRAALYNHYATPNSPKPDCISTTMGGPPETLFTPYGWRAARSRHNGGVNVLLADSTVKFVEDGIALDIWRGMSTRSGGEAVPE